MTIKTLGVTVCGLMLFTCGLCAAAGTAAPAPAAAEGRELPVRKIPNISETAEIYYAPDSYHLIGQLKVGEPPNVDDVTSIFTDDGKVVSAVNSKGDDACSFFFPDQKRVVWTSTRDHLDMPKGDWSDEPNYPQGAELYSSKLDGTDIHRLTNNKYYDAEVSVSPDGKWVLFGRQIDGKMDLWRIRPDGRDEQQITFTDDWQEGGAFYMPDSETIIYRAWKRSQYKKIDPLPMTLFTIKQDDRLGGTGTKPLTFDTGLNWAPYPAPDGRHYVYVRVIDGKNYELYLGDLQGGEPKRLTYNDGFDGFPALSPDGKKLVFARLEKIGARRTFYSYVMDVSSLNLGPEHRAKP